MSAAKHTLGEWSVLEHGGEVFVLANGAQQIAAVTYVIEHTGEQGSRRLQNARMMAAAPDLLDACEEALGALNGAEHALPGHVVGMLERAIAKASGSAS